MYLDYTKKGTTEAKGGGGGDVIVSFITHVWLYQFLIP